MHWVRQCTSVLFLYVSPLRRLLNSSLGGITWKKFPGLGKRSGVGGEHVDVFRYMPCWGKTNGMEFKIGAALY